MHETHGHRNRGLDTAARPGAPPHLSRSGTPRLGDRGGEGALPISAGDLASPTRARDRAGSATRREDWPGLDSDRRGTSAPRALRRAFQLDENTQDFNRATTRT